MSTELPILERTRVRFKQIAEEESLLQTDVTVPAQPLTPEEAIGTRRRRDFDDIWAAIREQRKRGLVYGGTAAGVCALTGIERICPCAREGR